MGIVVKQAHMSLESQLPIKLHGYVSLYFYFLYSIQRY
jgi:hypothetical protein